MADRDQNKNAGAAGVRTISDAIENAVSFNPGEVEGPCPVLPLGACGGIYFYLSPRGELRVLAARAHTAAELESLFDGILVWARAAFPRFDRSGRNVVGYELDELRQWLFREASEVGYFDADRDLRGPGAWRDEDGGLVLHCGDEVLFRDAWVPAGDKLGDGIIYPATAPVPRPADTPAAARAGVELIEFLSCWRWRAPCLAGRLWAGWIACAMVCGALRWRPHVLVAGGPGTGKTTLEGLAEGLLGPGGSERSADASPAGVRNKLSGAAKAVLLDEVENDPLNMRPKQIIELARIASTDGQGHVVRGSPEQRAIAQHIRAAFYFTAVLHPALLPQDASRITVLELDPIDADTMDQARIEETIAELIGLAPALRARMIQGWSRFNHNLQTYRAVLISAGCDSRQADQYSALLAAADVLTSDAATDAETAAAIVAELRPLEILPPDDLDADHWRCWAHLCSSWIEIAYLEGGSKRMAIGEVLRRVLTLGGQDYLRALRMNGIAIVDRDGTRHVVVANQHRALDSIFAGTQWHSGVWRQSLQRLPDATTGPPIKFGGYKARGTWLVAARLVELSETDDADNRPDGDEELADG